MKLSEASSKAWQQALRNVLCFIGATSLLSGCSTMTTRAAPAPYKPNFERLAPGAKTPFAKFAGTPVMVVFWASWCGTCKEELPSVLLLAEKTQGSKTKIVLVASMDEYKMAFDYVKAQKIPLPVLLDEQGSVAHRYGIQQLPAAILVSANGASLELLDPEDRIQKPVVFGAREWNTPEMVAFLKNASTRK